MPSVTDVVVVVAVGGGVALGAYIWYVGPLNFLAGVASKIAGEVVTGAGNLVNDAGKWVDNNVGGGMGKFVPIALGPGPLVYSKFFSDDGKTAQKKACGDKSGGDKFGCNIKYMFTF